MLKKLMLIPAFCLLAFQVTWANDVEKFMYFHEICVAAGAAVMNKPVNLIKVDESDEKTVTISYPVGKGRQALTMRIVGNQIQWKKANADWKFTGFEALVTYKQKGKMIDISIMERGQSPKNKSFSQMYISKHLKKVQHGKAYVGTP